MSVPLQQLPVLPLSAPAVGVVIARAGSKGFPGKNLALVNDKPCIVWTLQAMSRARRIGIGFLSTDSEEIASHRIGTKAEWVRRPAALASDTATVDDVARHAVRVAESQWRLTPATPVAILYGNVPVRPPHLIDRAIDLLLETGCDSVQSYAPVGKYHPWWMARLDEVTGRVSPWEGDVLNHGVYRRQDLPKVFIPDGGVLVVTKRALFHEIPNVSSGPHAFFGSDRRGIINGEAGVVDIDWPIDLLVADAILRGESQTRLPQEPKTKAR